MRLLKPNLVLCELQSALYPPDVVEYEQKVREAEERGDVPPEPPPLDEHIRWRRKEAVVAELAELFARSGEVRNLSKFRRDLLERERKSSTAVGGGLAIPHIRSMQPRSLIVCLARSRKGAEYLAEDGEPVHVFFGIASPSYDDSDYWKLYRWVANVFSTQAWLMEAILEAADENEIVRIMKSLH